MHGCGRSPVFPISFAPFKSHAALPSFQTPAAQQHFTARPARVLPEAKCAYRRFEKRCLHCAGSRFPAHSRRISSAPHRSLVYKGQNTDLKVSLLPDFGSHAPHRRLRQDDIDELLRRCQTLRGGARMTIDELLWHWNVATGAYVASPNVKLRP